MRITFMGTPDFSVPTLKSIINSHHKVVAVYSQPPREKGRGYQVQKSSVHLVAEQHNIPVFTPTSLRNEDAQKQFAQHTADIAVIVAYGLILPKAILDTPRLGCVNIHASILPRWRGAAPIQRAILAGDQETGITIMQMDVGLDTGDILTTQKCPITGNTTAIMLHDKLSNMGADLLLKTLDAVEHGKIISQKQPNNGVTYANKITKEEGLLNWNLPASQLDRQIRAFNPWPGTWFVCHDVRIKVLKAQIINTIQGTSGSFIKTNEHPWVIVCGDGRGLAIEMVQREGSRPMMVEEFLRGFSVNSLLE